MNEEADKLKEQQRQASNARNREQANHYQRIAEEYQEQANKKKIELERLNQAKSTLTKELSQFSTFENQVNQYVNTLDTGSFKGDLRDQFNDRVTAMGSSVHQEENTYQSNLGKLDMEISKRELEQGDLGKAISNAWDSVTNFLSSIF